MATERSLTTHPVPRGDVRTLVLPNGGTIDIPLLPGGRRRFEIKRPSVLHGPGGSRVPIIVASVVIGVVIGVGAAAWYYRSR